MKSKSPKCLNAFCLLAGVVCCTVFRPGAPPASPESFASHVRREFLESREALEAQMAERKRELAMQQIEAEMKNLRSGLELDSPSLERYLIERWHSPSAVNRYVKRQIEEMGGEERADYERLHQLEERGPVPGEFLLLLGVDSPESVASMLDPSKLIPYRQIIEQSDQITLALCRADLRSQGPAPKSKQAVLDLIEAWLPSIAPSRENP